MQPLKISKPLSISSRPNPKKYFIWLGIVVVALLLFFFFTPFVLRANRGVIEQELTSISQLETSKREVRLRRLLSVTGHDSAVAQALGAYYSSQGLHKEAGKTYERARGNLYILSAQEYALALDYTSVAKISRKATNQKPTVDSLAWQGIAFLNQRQIDKGCEKARESQSKDPAATIALQTTKACQFMQANESDPWKLQEVGLLQIALEQIQAQDQPTSSALVLKSRLLSQKEEGSDAVTALQSAFQLTPYDREVLEAVQSLCGQPSPPASCESLKSSTSPAYDLLPPR